VIAGALWRLRGVTRMLTYRDGWREHFDISLSGFLGSFQAAIWGIPFYIAILLTQSELAMQITAADPGLDPPATAGLGYALARYAAIWLYFPILARVFVDFFKIPKSYAPWVIVHNWTVLFVLIANAATGLPFLIGATSLEGYYAFSTLFVTGAVFAHIRAATGALDAPLPVAIGGAVLMMLIWLLIRLLLASAFVGGP